MKSREIIANIKPWHIVVAALILAGVIATLTFAKAHDTVARYAPAAEAFARGDWKYAFHPRFGVFFTGAAGVVTWILHCSGYTACVIVATLCFATAVWPLHYTFKQIWGNNVATAACLLYVTCSYLLRYAVDGLRDDAKTLALALIAMALTAFTQNNRSWRQAVALAAGCALLTILRGEGALIAILAGIIGAILLKDWRKIAVGALLYLLLISPQLYYNWRAFGYPVPELRHGVILDKIGVPVNHPILTPIPETAK